MNDVVAAGLPSRTVWVTHLTGAELASLRSAYPDFEFRPRIGTELWLGDRGALRVHRDGARRAPGRARRRLRLPRPDGPEAGHILVVSGGTAHGIGLEAPTGDRRAAGPGGHRWPAAGWTRSGFVRSPFTIDGKQRLFAEPPHMQASMLFLPARRRGARGRRRGRRPGPLHRDRLRPRRVD